jgi:hypothetical protein
LNPFVLSRLELDSPRTLEQVWASLERLLHDGFEAEGRRYRLFGARRGRYFSMSLGMPVLGGAAPVLRAWLADERAARFDVSVGARIEFIVLGGFWLALTVLGGGYQILLQLVAVAAGRATAADVLAVLPGIAVMAGILGLGFWLFRRRAKREALILLDLFRDAIGATAASAEASFRLRASS